MGVDLSPRVLYPRCPRAAVMTRTTARAGTVSMKIRAWVWATARTMADLRDLRASRASQLFLTFSATTPPINRGVALHNPSQCLSIFGVFSFRMVFQKKSSNIDSKSHESLHDLGY